MPRFNRNRNFRNDNNRRGYYQGNQSIQTPDYKYPHSKDMSNTNDYQTRKSTALSTSSRTMTSYQNVRSFDQKLNNVNVKLMGSAPIYGDLNDLKTWVFASDELGNYTASLNDQYLNDDFKLLSTISRKALINYYGIDWTTTDGALDKWESSLASDTFIANVQMFISMMEASQTWDLRITDYEYTTPDEFTKKVPLLATMLTQYQHELLLYVLYIGGFVRTRATLQKLQEFYPKYKQYLMTIDSELKRSRFTSKIRDIAAVLKQRWIDTNWVRDIITPFLILSKRTDGFNSPILYLSGGLATPIKKVKNKSTQIESYINTLVRDGDDINNYADKSLERYFNFWDLNEMLSIFLNDQSDDQKQAKLKSWLDNAFASVNKMHSQLMKFVNNDAVTAIEAMLVKLNGEPGFENLMWNQGFDINEVSPVTKFTDWEAVNTLVLFNSAEPVIDSNGYTMAIPFFQYDGIQKSTQLVYFQAFYMPSNKEYISLMKIGANITNLFRDGHITNLQQKRTSTESYYIVVDSTGNPGVETSEYASRAFQDAFTRLEYKVVNNTISIFNPQLMTYVKARFDNKAGDLNVWLKKIFLLPMA